MTHGTGPATIFTARRIRTGDPARPEAPAVAVGSGRILGVGTLEELRRLAPEAHLDGTFEDQVIVPGFVEAHSHVLEGALWNYTYLGWFPRTDPNGRRWSGCRSIAEVIERLIDAERRLDDPSEPLLAWGLDPIYFTGERLVARHLDEVSTTRRIFVLHASGHLATVNTALLDSAGIGADTGIEGVVLDGGRPNGELQEPAAMALAGDAFLTMFRSMGDPASITNLGALARNAGITTLTELGVAALGSDTVADTWSNTVDERFPARVVAFLNSSQAGGRGPSVVERSRQLAERNTDRLRFGPVKIILDGSIQGFTARLNPPGYLDGRPNGLWVTVPETMPELIGDLLEAGVLTHVHCNGDEAGQVLIEAVAAALERHPRPDHRLTMQHAQLTTPAQFRRMAALGMSANLFINHLWYWGDQHYELTVGPDRAPRMNACATALRSGVQMSFHTDAAITPLGHLHTMWCAVNRRTPRGRVLGPAERIDAATALQAATIGAAYQLRMDHEVGSIEPGKRADLTVLGADPLEVDPTEIRDIPVWGTVLGGEPQPAT